MNNLLNKYNIERYHVYNRRFKCAIAERVIQTIKRKIYKRMTHFNTYNFIDTLQDIVDVYNKTPHRGLGFKTPNFVHDLTNDQDISKQANLQYRQKIRNYGLYKGVDKCSTLSLSDNLKVGTFVRLLTTRAEGLFSKSFRQIYTEEIFVIREIVNIPPTRYYLKDLSGEIIEGTVYRQELKETDLPKTFAVEKVLKTKIDEKTRKNKYFVRFLGYPPKFDDWVHNLEKKTTNSS